MAKFGARDGVLRQPPDTILEEAARLGFDGIETEPPARDPYNWKPWDAAYRAEMKAKCARLGVVIASLCAGVLWQRSPASDDPAVREEARRLVERLIDVANDFGARVLLVPLTPAQGVPPDVEWQRWREGVRAVADYAQARGVTLALENVGNDFCKSAAEILELVQAIDHPAVGVYYDPGNAVAFGFDPFEEVRLLGRHIAQMHAKGPRGAALAEAGIDYGGLARLLREEFGYDGWWVLETQAGDDPAKNARANLAYLIQHIGR